MNGKTREATDDEEEWSDFMWACYDLAVEFLAEKKDCLSSTVYLRQEDFSPEHTPQVPAGKMLAVTVALVPLSEGEGHP